MAASGPPRQLRDAFREGVFARDNHKCRICGKSEDVGCQLDAHHITDRHEMFTIFTSTKVLMSYQAKWRIFISKWYYTLPRTS